jgi:DNA replication ATP-dependent helicase Dna2
MSKRKIASQTPKQNNLVDWFTTPPIKYKQVLDENSSPNCIFDPSPVQFKIRRSTSDQATFLDLLHSIDIQEEEAKTCPKVKEQNDQRDYFDDQEIDFQLLDSVSQDQVEILEKGYLRFLILEHELRREECSVTLLDERTLRERIMILRQDWLHSPVESGKYVHIILDKVPVGDIIIDNQNGLLVIDPDELISVTSLADSFQCLRRSVLNSKNRFIGAPSPSMIHGTILHSLFQEALVGTNFDRDFLDLKLKELIHASIESLYMIGQTEEKCYEELVPSIPLIITWFGNNCTNPNKTVSKPFRIVNPVEIEERIWSPKYGVKGNIDATVNVEYSKGVTASKIIPLELKTGKTQSIAHRAQTTIYTLMMSDRYNLNIDNGLLAYLYSGETSQVSTVPGEIRSILVGRNLFAHYASRGALPDIIDNEYTCNKCFSADLCMISHKALEQGTIESSKVPLLFSEKTNHLTDTDLFFISEWESKISMEEFSSRSNSKDLWTLTVDEREKQGSCISDLKLIHSSELSTKSRFSTLVKFSKPIVSSQAPTLFDSSFGEGDPVVILKEHGRHPLAIGIIQTMTGSEINVITDKPLQTDSAPSKVTYTLEKDSFSNGLNLIRGNLLGLFLPDGNSRLRELIVSLRKPTFTILNENILPDRHCDLNPDQRHAILKSLGCRDYSLILGMPGTGKTSTIANLIQILISRGKTVLYTSYTHSAVDNLLLKLLQMNVKFLRIGSLGKMHPQVKDYTLKLREKVNDLPSLTKLYDEAQVVATTALSINE